MLDKVHSYYYASPWHCTTLMVIAADVEAAPTEYLARRNRIMPENQRILRWFSFAMTGVVLLTIG